LPAYGWGELLISGRQRLPIIARRSPAGQASPARRHLRVRYAPPHGDLGQQFPPRPDGSPQGGHGQPQAV